MTLPYAVWTDNSTSRGLALSMQVYSPTRQDAQLNADSERACASGVGRSLVLIEHVSIR